MQNLKPFQLIVIGVCMFLGIVGVMVFAFAGGKRDPTKDYGPKVIVWGTADAAPINSIISEINGPNGSVINASYVKKPADTFNQDLLEALAGGKGPDVVLIPMEDILSYKNKIVTIPFSSVSERTFKDSFISEGELLGTHSGFLALPFSVDPLIMYWNRDIFTTKGKANPPADWSTLLSLVPALSEISSNLTVKQSAVSLGDYRNINHAKEILEALLFQAGNSISVLSFDTQSNQESLKSVLEDKVEGSIVSPPEAVLSFYTQFANPISKEYTWNRSLPNSLDAFVSGDLAMYFGLGSESSLIRAKNPNLNFDVALFPQQKDVRTPSTYGKMYSLAILSSSKNQIGAMKAVISMTGNDFLKRYQVLSGLSPVRRDLLVNVPTDSLSPVLFKSTFYSKGWLDPQPENTSSIFQSMVESSLAGNTVTTDIVQTALNQFNLVVNQFNQRTQNN